MLIKELKSDAQYFLQNIYFESDYIDPIQDIIDRISGNFSPVRSLPYGVYIKNNPTAFFTIDFSNPPANYRNNDIGSCWLDSFLIAKKFQGKGLSKAIVHTIIKNLIYWHPNISRLNLTVNTKNHIAKTVYLNCGFTDTSELFATGSSGHQHIYTIKLGK